jgi:predicted nucleic acid-binding Zn ribbon protein
MRPRIDTPPKNCEQCGATFHRKIGSQSLAQFAARKF